MSLGPPQRPHLRKVEPLLRMQMPFVCRRQYAARLATAQLQLIIALAAGPLGAAGLEVGPVSAEAGNERAPGDPLPPSHAHQGFGIKPVS